jgi:hypothetical protein
MPRLAEEGSGRRSQGSRGCLHHRRDRLDPGAPEQAEGAAGRRPQRRRRRQREGSQEGDGAAGAETAAGRRRPEVPQPGRRESPQLRRRHAVPEPDLPQQGGRGLRQRRRGEGRIWPRPRTGRTKAMGTRKANEEKKNAGPGGITIDNSGRIQPWMLAKTETCPGARLPVQPGKRRATLTTARLAVSLSEATAT